VLEDDIYMVGDAVTEADVISGWTQPVEGMPGQIQGFELRPGGVANSINMATLPYTSWTLAKGKLTLKGTSIGNGSSSAVNEVLIVKSVGKSSLLLLTESGTELTYRRQPLSSSKSS